MAIQNITIGNAPITWSNAKYAFDIANDNFQFLESQLNLNTASLDTDLIPDADLTRNIGSSILRWNELHVGDIYADSINIDGGLITVVNNQLVFVSNDSTVTTITAPSFESINVDGTPAFAAEEGDVLTFLSGTGISIVFDDIAKSLTFAATDSGGTDIINSTDINAVTDPQAGTTELFLVSPNKFTAIDVTSIGVITADTSSDTLYIDEGYGMELTVNPAGNQITIGLDPAIQVDDEFVETYAVPGTYTFDTYDGTAIEAREYKAFAKATEGKQYSTVATLYAGPSNALVTEYNIMLSENIDIAVFSISADVAGVVTVSVTTYYANTTIVYRKTSLSNV